jgi:nucleoside-diphosphate-sugar epimerase
LIREDETSLVFHRLAEAAPMKVLVTGGTGFLGSHVVERLVAEGHSVRALVRRTSDTRLLKALSNVELAEGAVEDAASVAAAMPGVEGIIHCAGLVKARSDEEFSRVNVQGTLHLLESAKRLGPGLRRFVMVSSLAAIGPSRDGRPVDPANPPGPVTQYGRSKLAAERRALEAARELPVTVIRPPMIYGPRDRESFSIFESVSSGVLPLAGDGKTTLSVIYVTDCAEACVRALLSDDVPSGSAYFVEDGRVYDWREMLLEVERALDVHAFFRLPIPHWAMRLMGRSAGLYGRLTGKPVFLTDDKLNELLQPAWVCDASATRRELGWTPKVSWSEGVRRSVAWYREHGWLK